MDTSISSQAAVSAQVNPRQKGFKPLLSQVKAKMSSVQLENLPATTWSTIKSRVSSTDLKHLPADTWAYIRAHPYKTTYLGSNIVLFAVPGLIASPVLGVVGFGAAGPVAGTAATAWQAASGSIAAGSSFAVLQSTAMGGYGVATVHGVVQGLTAVAGIGGLFGWKKGGVNENESLNIEEEESVDAWEYDDDDAEEIIGLKAFGL